MRRPTFGEAGIVLGAAVVIVGVTLSVLRTYETASETHKALCALRVERIQSVRAQQDNLKRSIDFLHRNPHGSGNISRADIQASIVSLRNQIRLQKGTVRAFRYLTC